MHAGSSNTLVLDETRAWSLLLELAARSSEERSAADGPAAFASSCSLDAATKRLLDLYLPLCAGRRAARWCLAHVGQSLDGQIATASGASRNVTGPENIRHMHRLRALCDAVLVGAETVEADDPQLTTRLVPGKNPTRVVIDPTLRSTHGRRLYRDDAAPTLILCSAAFADSTPRIGHAEVVPLACADRVLPPEAIVRALHERGLDRLFVEGGGVTVSRFLRAGALQRLHVTISPILIGSGSPGITLPPIDQLDQAWRPRTRRFELGDDVLFDCDFSA
jgi:riboflavin-specific deaminase-like protein